MGASMAKEAQERKASYVTGNQLMPQRELMEGPPLIVVA